MFQSIASKIANAVHKTVRILGSIVRREPVIATTTMLLALLLFVL